MRADEVISGFITFLWIFQKACNFLLQFTFFYSDKQHIFAVNDYAKTFIKRQKCFYYGLQK